THEMGIVLGNVADPAEAAQRLVDLANANGGADNITVVIVDVQVGEDQNGKALVTPIGRPTTDPTMPVRAGGGTAPGARGPRGSEGSGSPEGEDGGAGDGDRGSAAGAVAGAAAGAAALASATMLTTQQPAVGAPTDVTLAPGSQLGFGDQRDQTLADNGPHSDE